MKAKLRKDGRWEAKGVTPDGRRRSFYSQSEAGAVAKALASYGIRQDKTLYGFYAAVYVPTVVHRSDSWRSQIAWAMDKHVLPVFGNREMDSITRAELQRFFNQLGTEMKASTLKGIKIIMSGIFNLAEADEVIPRNHVRNVRLPSPQASNKTALSPEELWALLQASDDRLRPYILLTGFCGLRAGEALAVTRGAIKGGVLCVSQQLLQPKGGCKITTSLKTPQSKRDIPLPQALEGMILNSGQVSAVYVCSDKKGGYLTPNNAARDLEVAVGLAGIPRVTPHELRHTFISILENDLECPTAIVAALAGKSNKSVTAAYNHTARRQMVKWMDKFWERTSTSLTTKLCRQG